MFDLKTYKEHTLFMIPFYFGYIAGKSDSYINLFLMVTVGMLVVIKLKGSEG